MTLGEMKDSGLIPSETQIFLLEIEESKKCRRFGAEPHEFHCFARRNGTVYRETCEKVMQLRGALNHMFPSLKLKVG